MLALDQTVPTTSAGGWLQWSRRFDTHLLSVGGDVRWVVGETDERVFVGGIFRRTREAGGEQVVGGVFVQDVWSPHKMVEVVAGLRGDVWLNYNAFRDDTPPPAGIPAQPALLRHRAHHPEPAARRAGPRHAHHRRARLRVPGLPHPHPQRAVPALPRAQRRDGGQPHAASRAADRRRGRRDPALGTAGGAGDRLRDRGQGPRRQRHARPRPCPTARPAPPAASARTWNWRASRASRRSWSCAWVATGDCWPPISSATPASSTRRTSRGWRASGWPRCRSTASASACSTATRPS